MHGKVVGVLAFAVVALGTASAWAQDYTITTAPAQVETRPAGATLLNVSSLLTGPSTAEVTLPFEFAYYGTSCSTAVVCAHGMMVLGATGSIANAQSFNSPHGQTGSTSGSAFPYQSSGNVDGLVAVHWSNTKKINDGSADTGFAYVWTSGSAPNRHFVVSWENADIDTRVTFQCHLYEGTGRLVFAFSGVMTVSSNWVGGIDAPGDLRFMTYPGLNATANSASWAGGNITFDPRSITFTGRALYDRIVSDESGIGHSVVANQALEGLRVELRRDGGILANSGTIAADGTFSVPALGVASTSTGTAGVAARSSAVRITDTAGTATAWTFQPTVSYASSAALGTWTLGSAADATGNLRGALHTALTCQRIDDWAASRTSDPIGRLDVLVDPAMTYQTAYLKAGAVPAKMTVGSGASSNPDVWDSAIVAKTYGRHVLACIAASPLTSPDSRFDAVTDTQNAFAEAFGYYLWANVSGASQAIDGTSATTAAVYDLETPAITVAKGPDVAGCVAGALFDLIDSANDPPDAVDGTLTPDRAFTLVNAFTVAPTASTFLQAWVDAGFSAPSITRVFVGNGALADDALELNDGLAEAASIGAVGVRRSSLVLNRFNEDWFSVTLASASSSLVADAAYDRASITAGVGVEIRDAGGALLATGAAVGSTGPIRAVTGPVAAGTYRFGVRHLSGATIPSYTAQCYMPLEMASAPLVDWTVGREYDVSLGVAGGIVPYVLSTVGSSLPPGLSLSPVSQHALGTPTTPGSYAITVQLTDGGNPANIVTRSQTVTIHDVLKIALPVFVGFPAGKPFDATLPSTGGTAPITVAVVSGGLPAGLAFDANSPHVTGTPGTSGSTALVLDATDVAGSTDHVATRAVVTVALDVPNAPADLVAGEDACGWWFDAVQGSTVSFSAKTAKGRAKRLLAGAVLGPDRSLVTSASIKAKTGGLSVSKLVCPVSGRYHVIASSDAGDATQLTGTVKITAPKKGGAKFAAFDPTETISIPVGVLPGGTLTLKFAGDKKRGLTAKVVGMRNPAGDLVTYVNFVTVAPFGGTLTATLATGGTWTVVLGMQPASGDPGKLSYSYSVAQPKGVVYSAD